MSNQRFYFFISHSNILEKKRIDLSQVLFKGLIPPQPFLVFENGADV